MTSPFRVFAQAATSPSPVQQDVIGLLNMVIDWYQDNQALSQITSDPAESFFVDRARPMADQVLHLSFDTARAKAALLENSRGPAQTSTQMDPQYRSLTESVAKLDYQALKTQTQLDSLQRKLRTAPRSQRKALESSIANLQSALALIKTLQDASKAMLKVVGGPARSESLTTQIDSLEHTIPTSDNVLPNQRNNRSTQERPGLWGVLTRLYDHSRKLQTINGAIRQTAQLKQILGALQPPLRKEVSDLVQQTSSTLNLQASQDPAVLAAQKSALDSANNKLKLIGAIILPLNKELILLDSYQRNLEDWRTEVRSQFGSTLKELLFHLLLLGLLLCIVLGVFALWRRAVLRYVPNPRRRFQLLLIRRIALVLALSLIVILSFLNALGSLATFAGLLTAGIAVALQNVFLAIVGYFILIGKFGVRTGDRVQIADIKGEVVDIGFLRLQLLELGGPEADTQPTGRMVAFSNSVVFQPTTGFFKQVSSATLIWHEISLTLAPESDLQTVEQRISAAVDTAFKSYQSDVERLRSQMERNFESVKVASLEPKIRYRIVATGIEIHIRYPVDLKKAAEIDDRMTQELTYALEMEPRLKVVEAEGPAIHRKVSKVELDPS